MDGSFPILISKNDDANSATNPVHAAVVVSGADVSTSNPLPVVITNTPEVVTAIHDSSTSSVAGSGSSNHDYVVVGTKFRAKSVVVACSGKARFEIKAGPVASLVSKGIVLTNPSQTSFTFTFDPPITVPVTGTGTLRVIRTNNQNASNDVHTTIIGEDVA